jgi:hypothetical protein
MKGKSKDLAIEQIYCLGSQRCMMPGMAVPADYATFTIADSSYGPTFFVATGFHGSKLLFLLLLTVRVAIWTSGVSQSIPRAGGFEYMHRRPASRKRGRKRNRVLGDITGQPCPWGI